MEMSGEGGGRGRGVGLPISLPDLRWPAHQSLASNYGWPSPLRRPANGSHERNTPRENCSYPLLCSSMIYRPAGLVTAWLWGDVLLKGLGHELKNFFRRPM
jgi:hypothetical protein